MANQPATKPHDVSRATVAHDPVGRLVQLLAVAAARIEMERVLTAEGSQR